MAARGECRTARGVRPGGPSSAAPCRLRPLVRPAPAILPAMCRSIRPLRGRAAPPATTGDVHDAARQYLRKVAAVRRPPARDAAAFDAAVEEVATATARLLAMLGAAPVAGPATPPSAWPARPARVRQAPSPGLAGRAVGAATAVAGVTTSAAAAGTATAATSPDEPGR